MRKKMIRRLLIAAATLGAALGIAACGSGGGTTDVAKAPSQEDLQKPATGTLHVFAYSDTLVPKLIKPFEKQNPDLDVETAGFADDAEAAAKLAGGFQADVVEICADEAKPLVDQKLIRPLDTSGVTNFDKLVFHDSSAIRHNGKVFMVPDEAGFLGLVYNTEKVSSKIDSFSDLFDPRYKGQTSYEADYPLPPIAVAALAMGYKDPTHLTPDQIDKVSDYLDSHRDQFRSLTETHSDVTNLFKSGEVVIGDGDATSIAQDLQAEGVPVKAIAPKEGGLSWICGFGLSSHGQNTDAAYRFINYATSPKVQATLGTMGYQIVLPEAINLVPKKYRETADPSILKGATAEIRPPHYDLWTKALEDFKSG